MGSIPVKQELGMSYQERQSLCWIGSSVILMGVFYYFVYQKLAAGNWVELNQAAFWAKTFLLLIPVAIVVRIFLTILLVIIHRILTGEEDPTFMDERDKEIERKGDRISSWTFVAGFFAAMVTQAVGMELHLMFICIALAGLLSEILGESAKFIQYRLGK